MGDQKKNYVVHRVDGQCQGFAIQGTEITCNCFLHQRPGYLVAVVSLLAVSPVVTTSAKPTSSILILAALMAILY